MVVCSRWRWLDDALTTLRVCVERRRRQATINAATTISDRHPPTIQAYMMTPSTTPRDRAPSTANTRSSDKSLRTVPRSTRAEFAFFFIGQRKNSFLPFCTLLPFHRRNFVCDGSDLSPPLLKVVVTVTTTFSKWNLQFVSNYKFHNIAIIFLLAGAFCGLKYAENAIAAGAPLRTPLGELTTLPQST